MKESAFPGWIICADKLEAKNPREREPFFLFRVFVIFFSAFFQHNKAKQVEEKKQRAREGWCAGAYTSTHAFNEV